MFKVDIEVTDITLSNLQYLWAAFTGKNGRKIAPATKTVYDRCVRAIQECWQNWALGGDLPGASPIKNPSGNLARSIKIVRLNDFQAEIKTASPYMARIQSGTDEFDMKEKYPYGNKSRVSKEGTPFLIIPFQWGTPNGKGSKRAHFGNTIPAALYEMRLKKFKMSKTRTTTHLEPNYKGEDIPRPEYEWKDRLSARGIMEDGMVKMLDSATHKGVYFTFRIISAKSPAQSWIRKAVPPNDVVGAVKRKIEPEMLKELDEAIKTDLGL